VYSLAHTEIPVEKITGNVVSRAIEEKTSATIVTKATILCKVSVANNVVRSNCCYLIQQWPLFTFFQQWYPMLSVHTVETMFPTMTSVYIADEKYDIQTDMVGPMRCSSLALEPE
jgi:hypothetical protein